MGRNGFSIDDIVDMNYLGRLDKLVFRISLNYSLDLLSEYCMEFSLTYKNVSNSNQNYFYIWRQHTQT